MNRVKRLGREERRAGPCDGPLPGIVIHGRREDATFPPRIHAFVWGGKVRPTPTLPYGRWKGAA